MRTNRWTSRVNTKKILYKIYKIVVTNYNAKTFNEDCLMVIAPVELYNHIFSFVSPKDLSFLTVLRQLRYFLIKYKGHDHVIKMFVVEFNT